MTEIHHGIAGDSADGSAGGSADGHADGNADGRNEPGVRATASYARPPIEAEVLERITPTPDEEAAMERTLREMLPRIQAALDATGVQGRATVQGSLAKGTWLHGHADADLFLLLDPAVDAARFDDLAERVARDVLESPQRRYAQHPYIVGRFADLDVDVVPAYAVADPSQKMSAVDRTPFHTQWVRQNLAATGADEVRLLKQWLKGVGDYGAETAVGGFSGYLAEVLVVAHGSFQGVLRWLAEGAGRIALGPDAVDDPVSPLVVVDPVDPARNCAAAVTAETLAHAGKAARAYLEGPDAKFFFPPPPRAEPLQALEISLAQQHAAWTGLLLETKADLEQVLPQFQKAAARYADEVAKDIPVHRVRVDHRKHGARWEVFMQFLTADLVLPETRTHEGPKIDAQPNTDRFRAKWESHPDAAGPVQVQGDRLVVQVVRRDRTPSELVQAAVRSVPGGKHVAASAPRAAAFTEPPEPWRVEASEFILGREPWER